MSAAPPVKVATAGLVILTVAFVEVCEAEVALLGELEELEAERGMELGDEGEPDAIGGVVGLVLEAGATYVLGEAWAMDVEVEVDVEAEVEVELEAEVDVETEADVKTEVEVETRTAVEVEVLYRVVAEVLMKVITPPSPEQTSPLGQQPGRPFDPASQYVFSGQQS